MVKLDNTREALMGCERHARDEGSIIHEAHANGTSREEDYPHHLAPFVSLLTLTASISGFLFGYDTGVISSMLISIRTSLGHSLTVLDKSLITSVTALFALLGSPLAGFLADSWGRKKVILLADVTFAVGALIQASSYTVSELVLGRAVVGLAIGAASFVAPLYITELSPAPFRGRLVIVNVLFITIGQVVAYIVGWAFSDWNETGIGWRFMAGLGAVPAIIQFFIMTTMPETPRWLVMSEREDEARRVLSKVYGARKTANRTVNEVLEGIESERIEEQNSRRARLRETEHTNDDTWTPSLKDTWIELTQNGGNRRALIISCLLQALQQLCGFNSIMYFSASIFAILEFESPTFTSLAVASTNFFMTCAAFLIIDRIGRRYILLYTIPVMILGLLLCSLGFLFMSIPTFRNTSDSISTTNIALPRVAPLIVLFSIILFVGAYALGLGTVPWLQSELFPLSVRALGSGMSTSTNWTANFVVGLTFLPMMEFMSPTSTFIIYAAFCVLGWLAIWRFYPETSGYGLEDVKALLANGWGVERDKIPLLQDESTEH
ncbi:Bgt-976 [Blumeria graminis f. sp. tritici]|uniref:Myo-inositol transporter n=3 Tax=Blumeria graminis f. sp. tritici TaxID=62690 RepID=A0A656KN61_BLUGR|nr:Myo-inositol transporter [Blumeria graminis f. sp. tritici 96224]VCU41391.1 Bgt-976 [Blumeria graminis f. sp. tritici]